MAKISLFVGTIRALPESGRPSGIYKQPLAAPMHLGTEGFVGDQQADRRVHGGPEKAVHLYPAAHYITLAKRFPELAEQLLAGSMGENISTPDLDETKVHIGDIYCLGGARLQVCQPRNPCWKIDERFGCDGMAAYIAEFRLTGWYWRVIRDGEVSPDDELLLEASDDQTLTLAAAMQLWQSHRPALTDLEKLAATPGIAEQWRRKIEERANWLRKNQAPPPPTTVHPKPDAR